MTKNTNKTRRCAASAVGFLAMAVFSLGCATKGDLEGTRSSLKRLRSPSTGMEFVLVPAGTFEMGSPAPEPEREKNELQHRVTLTRRFYIGACEVTQEEFAHVMGFNPSTVKGSVRLPVETVSWFDAISFCNRLSEKDGLPAAYQISNIKKEGNHIVGAEVSQIRSSTGYRLPTEAEWEFACRAGTTTAFSFGATVTADQANFDGLTPYNGGAKGEYRNRTLEVDALPANGFGLYQMAGNVFEWCWDFYALYPPGPATDPTGPDHGVDRIRRGGSYKSPGHHLRSAMRHGVPPRVPFFHMGFRVARDPGDITAIKPKK